MGVSTKIGKIGKCVQGDMAGQPDMDVVVNAASAQQGKIMGDFFLEICYAGILSVEIR